jgi:hypothetical protein
MTNPNDKKPAADLSSLISAAQGEVKTFDRAKAQADAKPGARVSKTMAAVAAVVGIGAFAWAAGPSFLPVTDVALRQVLSVALEEARKDVEAFRKANGSLPAALPNMALAMMVEYEPRGSGYFLRASDGVRVVERQEPGGPPAR